VKLKAVIALFALVGVLLPAVVMSVDRLSPHGWWPQWLIYVWPTSYMLIANSAFTNTTAHIITIVAVVIDALIYALVGLVAYGVIRLIRFLGRRRQLA
jgi:hypothetical protein